MSTELPLSKIKKIARFDPDVVMINSEAVFALTSATEIFISLLAKQVHIHAASAKRKTLQQRDFDLALSTVPWCEFLDGALIGWDDEETTTTTTVVADDNPVTLDDDAVVEDAVEMEDDNSTEGSTAEDHQEEMQHCDDHAQIDES